MRVNRWIYEPDGKLRLEPLCQVIQRTPFGCREMSFYIATAILVTRKMDFSRVILIAFLKGVGIYHICQVMQTLGFLKKIVIVFAGPFREVDRFQTNGQVVSQVEIV